MIRPLHAPPRPTRHRRHRALLRAPLALATVLCVAGGLAACGEDSATEALDGEVPTEVPATAQITVADQQQRLQTLFDASGVNDDNPVNATYANLSGGPEILESIRAGETDLAYVGDTPPIQAQASGEDVRVVAAKRTSRADYQLAVGKNTGIDGLADLKGKKIAYSEGTARQPFVLAALEKAGLSKDDVELVPLQIADVPDALRSGSVDAAPVNEPITSGLIADSATTIIPEDETSDLTNHLTYLYARHDALADPEKSAAIGAYVKKWIGAEQWAKDNPDAWVSAYFAGVSGLTTEQGDAVVESEGKTTFPLLDDTLAEKQQKTVDILYDAGELPEKLEAAEEFDTRYNSFVEQGIEDAEGSVEPW